MSESARELIVFPTELSLRRYQQAQALKHGWVDTSSHTTFARLRKLCLPYARLKGRSMPPARELLMRRQVVEVARGHFDQGGALASLSSGALADVLEKLVSELASLPEEADRIVDWLLHRSPRHKLYQLGILFSIWRATIQQEGFSDRLDANTATLRLLKGNRNNWPPLLRDCRQLTFKSVRWFNPFEESCIAALNQKLKLLVESAQPSAHAETSADRLGQAIRAEIMAEPWAVWAEDLGDALAVDSPDVLQLDDADRISFSRSAGAYGEIEDLARRICWNIQGRGVASDRIALVVPNIGTVQDIVPHVFSRFQIPYFFRRGRPVLSSPCVKALLSWLAFPLHPKRDILVDLVRNPAIVFDDREAVVEGLVKMPPRIDLQSAPWFKGMEFCSGTRAAAVLSERIIEPEDHFNREALKAVEAVFDGIGEQSLPLRELVDLVEELLEEATVRPRDSHEQGVWILNPHDAVGLDFDLVLFAGLNEGEFPSIPQQDALLSDKERYALRMHLEEQGRRLPAMALASADVLFEQESVLFLAALGMAREQLVLSCQAVDQEGNEKGDGDYFRKLWNLAGWCAQDEVVLSPYDQWRIALLGEGSVFSSHWIKQLATDPEDRVPMPGESFLPIVPLPLCRAKDEALQAAVQRGRRRDACNTEDVPQVIESGSINLRLLPVAHVVEMLEIEAERKAFLETFPCERTPSAYCGHVDALKERVADWFESKGELSPTALEALARCRYVFLLERIFGLRDPRMADDTPDPAERGGLIHTILQEVYTAIAAAESGIDAPRHWAVKTSKGWVRRTEGGAESVPLAVFVPGREAEYVAFARKVAEERMDQSELGHPGVWAAEREKVLEMVLNFVRYDARTCAAENRCPALFEHQFGGGSAVGLEGIKLHGIIDRVDLVFEETGALKRIRVLDYKGSSSARSKTEDYVDDIRRNLNCQIPVYAFAAQQHFLGDCNTEAANEMTEAGYLVYQREYDQIGKTLRKGLVSLNEPEMIEGFLATLSENLRRLKGGDFAVDPLVETYNDYESICRTTAVSLDDLE